MSTKSPVSKSWQRPSGRIKLKVKKKKTSTACSTLKNLNVLKPVRQDGRVAVVKRKNPFGCSPRKRKTLETALKEPENKLFRALDGENEDGGDTKENVSHDVSEKENTELDNGVDSLYNTTANNVEETATKGSNTFPLDWSLKSKVRFTSSQSFNWSRTLKSSELAEGVSNFVRCDEDVMETLSSDLNRTLLYKESKVWIHPSLPWIQLFPRKTPKKYPGKMNVGSIFLDPDLALSLHQDWVSSFHSVFNLLRCGHCSYFYLCANECSMVFIAAGVSNNAEVKVVITPTTRGFRDALAKEGIEFTLPHGQAEEMNGADSDTDDDIDDKHDENDSENEEEWLQSMGLKKEQFPTLEPHKKTNQQNAKIRNTDQHPNSTVLVQGTNTQALANFLLNWRSITSKNGQLAGIPPTLISPVAFEGATLKSHKVSQGVVKHQLEKGMKQLFSLEVTGPLLPGCVQTICKLLQTTQNGGFTATMMQHQPTVAFNAVVTKNIAPIPNEKCGLSTSQAEYFSQTSQELEKICVKELTCKDGLYSWKLTGPS